MAEKKNTEKVGSTVEVGKNAEVTRPNGERVYVTGGLYVLDVPGEYLIDGENVTVK